MIRKMIVLDWRAMKYYQNRFWLLPISTIAIGLWYPVITIPFCVYFCLCFSVNPFTVEEQGELNRLYLTLPVKRREIVNGRYALSFILLLCGIIMGLVITPVTNYLSVVIQKSEWIIGFRGYITMIAFSYLAYSVLNLSMFPILFKLGYAKGKIWGFYLPIIACSVLMWVYYMVITLMGKGGLTIKLIGYASENILLVSGGMIVLGTGILYLSYLLSVKINSKRDF